MDDYTPVSIEIGNNKPLDGYKQFAPSKEAIDEEFDVSSDPKEQFIRAGAAAAKEVVRLSTKASSEALRFKAACYILDKTVFMESKHSDDDALTESLTRMLKSGSED